MKQIKITRRTIFYSLVFTLIIIPVIASGQVTLGEDIDCTNVTIDYSDDHNITQEERLRRMDRALFDSLNKFEFCQSIKEKKETSGQTSSGSAGENGNTESIASSAMSGTDSPSPTDGAATNAVQSPEDEADKGTITPNKKGRTNGKRPEDIPAVANDDVLAAQIRYAAENEKDTEKQELLWDEYRKYKGLPPQKK